MNVLVLNGSPKTKSDTMHITEAFLEGLNEKGNCEIRTRHIIKMDIKPCRGCFSCWKGDDATCAIKDDMKVIWEDILWAELIIWSFPLYCYGMPSHLKAVCDRTIPFAKLNMVERDGRTYHESKVDLSKKRYLMISGCGFPNLNDNFEAAVMQFQTCYSKYSQAICISEAPLFVNPDMESVTKPKLDQVKEVGKVYFETGKIPESLLEDLAKPMIPNDQYISIINSVTL